MTKNIISVCVRREFVFIDYIDEDGKYRSMMIDVKMSTISDENITAWTFTAM